MKSFMQTLDPKVKKSIKIGLIAVAVLVVFLLGVWIYRLIFGIRVSYTKLETIIENSAVDYFANTEKGLPTDDGETNKVTTDELIEGKFMRTMDKYTKDLSCTGKVTVTNNGGNYLYNTYLDCDDYKTKSLAEVIESSLVTSGDGLYLNANEYYYRGEYVNNYITINGQSYRILGIDANGNLKIADLVLDRTGQVWDDRYNFEKKSELTGINDYEKSRFKEAADSYYDSLIPNLKKYIINYDWCIGSRSKTDGSMNAVECSKTIKDYAATFIPTEVVRASLDEKCTTVFSENCENYNYITNMFQSTFWTLTSVSENTCENFYGSIGTVGYSRTSRQYKFVKLFNISGNNVYVSGDGSQSSPYVIK